MSRLSWTILCLAVLAIAARTAAAETTGEADGDTWFHVGAGLTVRQPVASDVPIVVPELELGLIAGGIVDMYLALGLDVQRESFEDDDRESVSTAGALSTELGARFIVGAPRPQRAFFYVGIAVAPVIGIASYESDTGDAEADAEADYYEDRAREYLDRFDLGLRLGVEYLVSADFGLGAQTGFMVSLNNLRQTSEEEPDRHLQVGFFIPFSIRASYHF